MVVLPGIRYPVSDKVQEDTFLLFNCGHYSLDIKKDLKMAIVISRMARRYCGLRRPENYQTICAVLLANLL